ncbi:MAG: hypothetical protein ACM3ML_05120 [Micromonosporaceae bacterium]
MNAFDPALTGLRPADGPVPVATVLCGPCDDALAWQLPADPLSAPRARALCRGAARAWAVPDEAAQALDAAWADPGDDVTGRGLALVVPALAGRWAVTP